MKTIRILKVTKARVTRGTHHLALPCLAAGVGLANAAVCAGAWHPFHGAMAIFGFATSLLLTGIAVAQQLKNAGAKTEPNQTTMVKERSAAFGIPRACNSRRKRPARFCSARFAPR